MKKLHKLLLKSYVGPLVATFFIALFVLIMQFLFRHIDDLAGKGLEITVIAELLLYASASLIPMAMPLAVLLSSLMTFGDLGEYYELIALKSSGISLLRIMYPLFIVVICITLGTLAFTNYVVPKANLKTGALLYDIKRLRPELNIQEGTFNNDISGYTIRAKEKVGDNGAFKDFMIYDHTENRGNRRVTYADSAEMSVTDNEKYLIVNLYDGRGYEEINEKEGSNSYPMRRNKFERERLVFELSGFQLKRTDESLFKDNYQMLTMGELNEAIDSMRRKFTEKRERFYRRILTNHLFKKESGYYIKDSSRYKKLYTPLDDITVQLDVDSIYENFPKTKRNRIHGTTKNFIESTLSYVESNTANLTKRHKNIAEHQVQFHRIMTFPFACIVFFFVGAPLGAIIRRGGLGLPVVVSVLFFIAYYIISISGEKFVEEGLIHPIPGMWTSSIVLLMLGLFLTHKAVTDSTFLNVNYYITAIKNLFKKNTD